MPGSDSKNPAQGQDPLCNQIAIHAGFGSKAGCGPEPQVEPGLQRNPLVWPDRAEKAQLAGRCQESATALGPSLWVFGNEHQARDLCQRLEDQALWDPRPGGVQRSLGERRQADDPLAGLPLLDRSDEAKGGTVGKKAYEFALAQSLPWASRNAARVATLARFSRASSSLAKV